MAAFQTLDNIQVQGKIVLVRADLNVPMQDGVVSDSTRLDRLAPTITELCDKGAKVVLMSHFGRPKGGFEAEYSLSTIQSSLQKSLGRDVAFAIDCISEAARSVIANLKNGQVACLENLRFHKGEEKNDPEFARALAALGDVYVNDAFSASHRAHASISGVASLLPAYAGRLMEAELNALASALETPQRPVLAVVGGAKISTKLELLGNLVKKVDYLVLGGGMANTFLAAGGVSVGKSLCENDMLDSAREISATAAKHNCKIILPTDVVVAAKLDAGVATECVKVGSVPSDKMILDLGSETAAEISKIAQSVKTVLWNGPLGVFEVAPFDAATNTVAKAVASATQSGLISVAGGGDTVSALSHAGVIDQFSYVSSAGGAFLEWLEGKDLPGVAALKNSASAQKAA